MTRKPLHLQKPKEKKLTDEHSQVAAIGSIDLGGRCVSSRLLQDTFDLGICTPTPPEIEGDVNNPLACTLDVSDSLLEVESSARTSKRRRQPKIMADGLPAIIVPPVRSKSLCSMSEPINSQGLLINTSHFVQRDPEVIILHQKSVEANLDNSTKNHSASPMISLSSDCESSLVQSKASGNHAA